MKNWEREREREREIFKTQSQIARNRETWWHRWKLKQMKKKKHEEEDWRKYKGENQNEWRRQRPKKIQRRHDCCCLS